MKGASVKDFIALVIENPKTELKKVIEVTDYSVAEFIKTTELYFKAGFDIEFKRFVF